mgnify:CR=1 FL=1
MILYLLSKDNLAIKAVKTLSSYEFKEDIDFNDSSTIVVADYLQMDDGDYALIKDGEAQVFFGICQEMKPSDTGYTITLKQKESLFDTTIYNDGEALIQSAGMEDYIAKAIQDNFISSGDALMDMDYIQVTASTHTKVVAKVGTIVDAENGVYNLKTFLGNVRQNYGIFLDFAVSNGRLGININNREQTVINIDTKLPEITNLTETYSIKVLAKLIVKWDTPKEMVTTDMVTTRMDITEPGYVADAVSIRTLNSNLSGKTNTSDFNNLKNSIVMVNVTGFAIGIDGNNVIIQWLTGANREFGYALNIGTTDGTMQFFYRENGTWKPSWNK